MLSSKNINEDAITNLNDVRYLSKADFDISNNRTKVTKGDVLFTSVGSIGRTCIYDLLVPVAFQRSVTVMTTYIYNRYFKLFLDSPLYQNYVFENARGTAQKGFYINQIENSLIPIPPYNEQIKIVEITEKLLSFVKKIEEERNNIIENIYRIKSEILDLAISGKLAPQNSADEPAIELLRKINPAFKPCDNSHYENLPENWCLAKVKDVFVINPRNKAEDNTIAGFIPMTLIDDGYSNTFSYEKRKWGSIKTGFSHFADGDVAVAKISPCLENRKSIVLRDLPNAIGAGTTELHVFRSSVVVPEYALYFFKSEYFISKCVGTFNGVVGQQRVGKNIIEEIQIPIPPINEQTKIVSTIETIFTQLNTITAEL